MHTIILIASIVIGLRWAWISEKNKTKTKKPSKVKHTTETTHYYEPFDGLKIEIESNGLMWIWRDKNDPVHLDDLYFTKPDDVKCLLAIADVIKLHYKTIIEPTLTRTSDEQ